MGCFVSGVKKMAWDVLSRDVLSGSLLNDIPNSSAASPLMSWVCHFSVLTPWCNTHGKGFIMLHHLAGATLAIANLVNYNCHPFEGGKICSFKEIDHRIYDRKSRNLALLKSSLTP